MLEYPPDIMVFMPCGCDLPRTLESAARLNSLPGFDSLPAARDGRVYAVDANAYFARPGPRVVDGAELMAHLIHPDLFDWEGGDGAYRSIAPLRTGLVEAIAK